MIKLYDARTSELLWEKNYDEGILNIFELRIDIVEKIASALAIELTLNEKIQITQKPTLNPIAYDYYLKGSEYLYHGHIQNAIDSYKKAFIHDPSFVQAFVSLSKINYSVWMVILSQY